MAQIVMDNQGHEVNTVTVSVVLRTNYPVEKIVQWVGEALSDGDHMDSSMEIDVRSLVVEADEVPDDHQ